MLYIDASCTDNVFGKNGMELQIFLPQTSQITSGILRLFFLANNVYAKLGIAQISATMVDYAQIDAMLQIQGYF